MLQISIVVPCFNEETVLPFTNESLTNYLVNLIKKKKVGPSSIICYVDDGSTDKTWQTIETFSQSNNLIKGIKLSRNRGHQNALLAGLRAVPGDAVVTIDADLQDDINAIEDMIDSYNSGTDIVYGVRNDRQNDTKFKRSTAHYYYKFLSLMGVEIVENHADFRLLSRRLINELKDYRETNLFLRGIIPQIGFNSSIIYYKRGERVAGVTKYPLHKMLSFAWRGVTSTSVVPLRLITMTGIAVFCFTTLMSLLVVALKLFTNLTLPGWTSIVLPIYILGGIQILFLGIVGEYLGNVYQEVKMRPRYAIEKIVGLNQEVCKDEIEL